MYWISGSPDSVNHSFCQGCRAPAVLSPSSSQTAQTSRGYAVSVGPSSQARDASWVLLPGGHRTLAFVSPGLCSCWQACLAPCSCPLTRAVRVDKCPEAWKAQPNVRLTSLQTPLLLALGPLTPAKHIDFLCLLLCFLSFFSFLAAPRHMDVPGPGIKSELELKPRPQL